MLRYSYKDKAILIGVGDDASYIADQLNGAGPHCRELVKQANLAAGLVAACKKWIEHYDACVRMKHLGDEPGIAEIRKLIKGN